MGQWVGEPSRCSAVVAFYSFDAGKRWRYIYILYICLHATSRAATITGGATYTQSQHRYRTE